MLRTPLAVPGKIFGLALFLDFSDRCASKPSLHRPPDALGLAARDGSVARVQIRFIKDKRHTRLGMPFAWRRRGDLNPRDGHPPYSLSRGASSPREYFSTVKIFCVYSLRSRHGKPAPASERWITFGGERGIRTPGPFGSPVFKTGSINRSDISPCLKALNYDSIKNRLCQHHSRFLRQKIGIPVSGCRFYQDQMLAITFSLALRM